MPARACELEPIAVSNRKIHVAVGVEDVDRRNALEAVPFRHSEVAGGGVARPRESVAVDDRPLNLVAKEFEERRIEVRSVRGFEGDLDAGLSPGRAAERLIELQERFGRDFAAEIHYRRRRIIDGMAERNAVQFLQGCALR